MFKMYSREKERQFLLECITLYRELPALWKINSKEYSDRKKKAESYNTLLEKYKEFYPEADRDMIKKKINSLRTNYRKELKKVQDSYKNWDGNNKYQPTLWYFNEMSFLEGEDENYDRLSGEIKVEEYEEEKDEEQMNIKILVNKEEPSPPPAPPPPKMIKVVELNQPEQIDKCKHCGQKANKDQEFEALAKTWIYDLQKMDPIQQLFAKRAIAEVLFEGQLGTLGTTSSSGFINKSN